MVSDPALFQLERHTGSQRRLSRRIHGFPFEC